MIDKPVYLDLANPYAPLTSDRTATWLASLAAVYHDTAVRCLGSELPEKGSLLVTNRKQKVELIENLDLLRLESGGQFTEKIFRRLGILYGQLPDFHAKGGSPLRSALTRIARTFLSPREAQPERSADILSETNAGDVPARDIAFRINIDWDAQGFEALASFMEQERIPLTIAAAVDEIRGNLGEVRELAAAFEIEIASHSMGHYIFLPGMSGNKQRREIRDSRNWLQDNLNTEVKGFVAPYMRYDRRAFEIIEEAGYDWFIRTWALCPVPLQGTTLTDLGVSYYLKRNWKESLPASLRAGNILFQLHLPDMRTLSAEIGEMILWLKNRGCRFVTCSDFLKNHRTGRLNVEH